MGFYLLSSTFTLFIGFSVLELKYDKKYFFLLENFYIWEKCSTFALGFGWVAQQYVVKLKSQRLMSQQMLKRLGGTNCGKSEKYAGILVAVKETSPCIAHQ